jgi:hypothetical protein
MLPGTAGLDVCSFLDGPCGIFFGWFVSCALNTLLVFLELKIASLVVIGLGWLYYFFMVEMKQLKRKDSLN